MRCTANAVQLITRGDEAEKERNFDERLLAAIFLKVHALPDHGVCLTAGKQNESGSMWARADPSDKEDLRRFLICSVESELSMEVRRRDARRGAKDCGARFVCMDLRRW